MPVAVSMESTYEPVEVDLWGSKYETKDLNRPAFQRLSDLQAEIDALAVDDGSVDKFVEKVGEFCDLKMDPVKGTVKASTLVQKRWKSGKLKVMEVASFIRRVSQAEQEANRPT